MAVEIQVLSQIIGCHPLWLTHETSPRLPLQVLSLKPHNPQLRRSVRLQSKLRPDYRFPSKTTLWQDRSICEADEDEEWRNYVPFIQETVPKTIARETTVGRELGVIEASNVIASGIDWDTYHPRNPREVRKHYLVRQTVHSPQHSQS